jgi:acyl-coenzyme A synthetase/AMP-(fatty) acid ligase
MWLWGLMGASVSGPTGALHDIDAAMPFAGLRDRSCFPSGPDEMRGRNVIVFTRRQATTAFALMELDGVARRVVICPPDMDAKLLPGLAALVQADIVVGDDSHLLSAIDVRRTLAVSLGRDSRPVQRICSQTTEWILLTSGTTGTPKLVQHTLESLTSAFRRSPVRPGTKWGTFYDIRRYGGLQILLRSAIAGTSLVLSNPQESSGAFLERLASAGVTHVSGTPSHWRNVLMSGAAALIKPCYVRLSGEIADQSILDHLRAAYPDAVIAHAFASTEAGVAFEVDDGAAGFPVALCTPSEANPELKVAEGTLRIRSDGNAVRYLNQDSPPLCDADGFVDTGDRVELHDGRYCFRGRMGGVINVGGLKVFPEEVESVLNAHPRVRMSLVKARRSPITGAIVTADIVLADAVRRPGDAEDPTGEIIEFCRSSLPPHKVPTLLRIVTTLAMSDAGKLARPDA